MHRSPFRNVVCGFLMLVVPCLSGCIERSTVIKVKKDGSGVVHFRHHGQKIGISFAGSSPQPDQQEENKLPSQDELSAMAKAMGSGVQLLSATQTTNRNDWDRS